MNKQKVKAIERRLKPTEFLEAPIFLFTEEGNYVVKRSLIEGLGYSTQSFKSPVEGGGVYKAGDSSLCLLPKDHELIIKDDNYIQIKGAIGLSIEL